jgi:hypothetical protein
VERAVVLGSSEFILAEDLPETFLEDVSPAALGNAQYHQAIRTLKKQLI